MPFVGIFASNRKRHQWALLPAYIWFAIGIAVLLELSYFWTPAYLAIVTAVPFLYLYAFNRERREMLITGSVLAALGTGYIAAAAELPSLAIVPVTGIFFVARMVSREQVKAELPQAPRRGPEADKAPVDYEALGTKSA